MFTITGVTTLIYPKWKVHSRHGRYGYYREFSDEGNARADAQRLANTWQEPVSVFNPDYTVTVIHPR